MTSCFVARISNPGERFGKPFYEVDVPSPLGPSHVGRNELVNKFVGHVFNVPNPREFEHVENVLHENHGHNVTDRGRFLYEVGARLPLFKVSFGRGTDAG